MSNRDFGLDLILTKLLDPSSFIINSHGAYFIIHFRYFVSLLIAVINNEKKKCCSECSICSERNFFSRLPKRIILFIFHRYP
jgi:hypothetical protein